MAPAVGRLSLPHRGPKGRTIFLLDKITSPAWQKPGNGPGDHFPVSLQPRAAGRGAAGFLEARKILKTSTLFKPKLFVQENPAGGFDVVKRDLYESKDSVVQNFDNRVDADAMVKEKGGLGLEPIDPNYITMMQANLWEKARWLMDNYIKNDLEATDFLGTKKMPGWVPVADKGIWRDLGAPGFGLGNRETPVARGCVTIPCISCTMNRSAL